MRGGGVPESQAELHRLEGVVAHGAVAQAERQRAVGSNIRDGGLYLLAGKPRPANASAMESATASLMKNRLRG